MLPPHDYNPITCLWERLGSSMILNHHLFKRFKLTKLCMVLVLGNVKDKCIFSNLAFIKTKFQNRFTTHLDLVVQMCVKILWFKKLSFLLKYSWLEWMPIAIWGWCIVFIWHCIIGFVNFWFINACWRLVALVENQFCIPIFV